MGIGAVSTALVLRMLRIQNSTAVSVMTGMFYTLCV